MPGVNVDTATRSGPVAQDVAPSGHFFVAGLAERGPVGSVTKIASIAEFASVYGTRQSYSHLYDCLATFFEEGGSVAYVSRAVGPSPTKGKYTWADRAGSPVSTLDFEARSPGAWSANVDVVVANGITNTVNVTVLYNDVVVESYSNLANPAAVAAAFVDSPWVKVTNLGSATSAPNNNPAVGTHTLSTGTDDHTNATVTEYTAALNFFVDDYGVGCVAIPGVGTSVHAALVDHCEKSKRRIALLSAGETADASALEAAAAAVDSEFAGLFAPWVQISTEVGTAYTSPEGYVAGVRNRAHSQVGPWRAPAGSIAAARSLVGLKFDYTKNESDDLDAANVNVIRIINSTIRLYGWTSLSSDDVNYALLTGRDVLNYVVGKAELALEEYVFATVDAKGHLLSAINGALVGVVDPMAKADGLYPRYDANGNELDPGWSVDTGPGVNPIASLANNVINAVVSIRISPNAAMINVLIVKVGLTTGL